ncbi:uncharacterized protein EI90DRAFT_2974508 [Cantharellus anzutake]|uniref:uncharacterized protein n=1 Tax=Cantharellus anzutake TaxID=1750568 RepID=UPI001907FB23|nr:uncharacterized protein EI90DRAFT_2974508 [Cantharellus anzutake]KAF8328075.1 hypothetical protein EI90DRAFT_2974508 [Cantharellus anzutake]
MIGLFGELRRLPDWWQSLSEESIAGAPGPKYAETLLPHLVAGLFRLWLAIFVSTYGRKSWTTLVRLFVAPFAITYFYKFGFSYFRTLEDGGDFDPQLHTGIATVALYCMMRIMETCVIQLSDGSELPRVINIQTGTPLPLPSTFRGRLAYSIDLVFGMRGCSWRSGRYWDFAAPRVVESIKQQYTWSRGEFLRKSVAWFVICYFTVDAVDTFVKSMDFNVLSPYPVSATLPLWLQILCAIALCTWIYLGIAVYYCIISIFFTFIGITSPEAWPPMFNMPFFADSIADFWGNRWHYLLRQTFGSLLSVFSSASDGRAMNPRRLAFHRGKNVVIVFIFSTLLHLIIMDRVPIDARRPHTKFWDVSIISFYLAQPIGIILESLLVLSLAPNDQSNSNGSPKKDTDAYGTTGDAQVSGAGLTKKPLPPKLRVARRIFAWIWLVWSARWWADAWVNRGLWEPDIRVVYWSPIRGLLIGDWTGIGKLSK